MQNKQKEEIEVELVQSEACEQCIHNVEGDSIADRTKERSKKELKDMLNRLNRIEGQIRGIKGMVEKGVYCTDIIVQVAAVNAALNSFNRVLLSNHIRTCVTQDIQNKKEGATDELIDLLKKIMH